MRRTEDVQGNLWVSGDGLAWVLASFPVCLGLIIRFSSRIFRLSNLLGCGVFGLVRA